MLVKYPFFSPSLQGNIKILVQLKKPDHAGRTEFISNTVFDLLLTRQIA